MTETTYSASCPACGYEHDFNERATMERVWKRWIAACVEVAKEQRRAKVKA